MATLDFPCFELNLFNENVEEKKGEVEKNVSNEETKTSSSRFVVLSEEERSKLLDESMAKTTKYNTKWVVTLFSFAFESDEKGQYITMAHDEPSKNHPGGLMDKPSNEKYARMYETDSKTDGYKAMKLLFTKLNPKCEALFQAPRRDWKECHFQDESWYENRPLGVNSLGTMMKAISLQAKLSRAYTNHCVRATSITLWSEAGLVDRHICHISGHRNPASLRHYNSRPSTQQLQQCSDVLSTALTGRKQPNLSVIEKPEDASFASLGGFGSLFNGCNISSVQVTFADKAPPSHTK